MLVHAAGESSPGGLPPDTYAVVLAVPNEQALEKVAATLHARCVDLVEIHESDPPWSGQLMALGLAPKNKEVLRRYVSSLPLLR